MSPLLTYFSFTILITTLSSPIMAYPSFFPGFSYPPTNSYYTPPFSGYTYPSPPDYNNNPGYAYPPLGQAVPSSPDPYPSYSPPSPDSNPSYSPPSPKHSPSPPSPPSDSLQQEFLDAHNEARSSLGEKGLTWSDTLASYAANYAAQRVQSGCDLVHSHGRYGENLAEGTGLSARDAVQMWVDEKQYYDHSTNSCTGEQECGHYTQVVWRNTKTVGCNRAQCSDGETEFVICSYDPPGNYVGQSPY